MLALADLYRRRRGREESLIFLRSETPHVVSYNQH